MANDLNQCNFIGRLGADPTTRYAPSGDAICNFRIAVGWKTKEKEGTEWVPCVTMGKLAEVCSQWLKKGSQIFVSGRFVTREWEKDGVKRYSTEIRVDQMQMLGKGEGAERPQRPERPSNQSNRGTGQREAPASGGFGDFDSDEIPF